MFQGLADEQWTVLAPLLPPRVQTWRPRANDRQTLNGILYVLATGCRRQDVPSCYGSDKTRWHRLRRWQREGVWNRLWQALFGDSGSAPAFGLGARCPRQQRRAC